MTEKKKQNYYLTAFRGGTYLLALAGPSLGIPLAISYFSQKDSQATNVKWAENDMASLLQEEAAGEQWDYKSFKNTREYNGKPYTTTEYKWITMKESKEIQQKEIDRLKDMSWEPSTLVLGAAVFIASALNYINFTSSGFSPKCIIVSKRFDKILKNAADYCQKTQGKLTALFQSNHQPAPATELSKQKIDNDLSKGIS